LLGQSENNIVKDMMMKSTADSPTHRRCQLLK
jgi:hypothetical protein